MHVNGSGRWNDYYSEGGKQGGQLAAIKEIWLTSNGHERRGRNLLGQRPAPLNQIADRERDFHPQRADWARAGRPPVLPPKLIELTQVGVVSTLTPRTHSHAHIQARACADD